MNDISYRIVIAFFLISGIASCGNAKAETTGTPTDGEVAALELPVLPDSLVIPQERAAYALDHFWDAMDFVTDDRCLDTLFVEQTFANFLAILSVAQDDVAQKAVSKLLDKVSSREAARELISYVVDKYLDEPGSPMRNEDQLMMFLRHTAADESLPSVVREVAAIRLSHAEKNRPGTVPADFHILTSDGQRTTLHKCLNGMQTIVMFYDPDCEHCMDIKKRLAEVNLHEGMQVVAIDVVGDKAAWEANNASMPSGWIVGFALDPIEEEETYVFREMPTFYVIGSDGKISMKDPDPRAILGD